MIESGRKKTYFHKRGHQVKPPPKNSIFNTQQTILLHLSFSHTLYFLPPKRRMLKGEFLRVRVGAIAFSSDGTRLAVEGFPIYRHRSALRVYERKGTRWVQIGQTIYIPFFTYLRPSIALSSDGTRLAVGVDALEEKGLTSPVAQVYQYERNYGKYTWTQVGQDLVTNSTFFGPQVAISSDGTRIAVLEGNRSVEVVHEYECRDHFSWSLKPKSRNCTWTQVGQDLLVLGNFLDLSADGSQVVCHQTMNIPHTFHSSSINSSQDSQSTIFRARVYELTAKEWSQVRPELSIQLSSGGRNNHKRHLAFSSYGTRCAVYLDDNIRIYDLMENNTGWTLVAEVPFRGFFRDLAISSDGTRIAVSCKLDLGGYPQQHVYDGYVTVYELRGKNWSKVGEVTGDGGCGFALSSDGTQIAFGCDRYGGQSLDGANVTVYQFPH